MKLRDHPLLEYRIPASFILARALPTREELVYGYLDGWLSRRDVIVLAEARYDAGLSLSSSEEALVMLLRAEVDGVPALVRALEADCDPAQDPVRLWLFLALAWLLEWSETTSDPYRIIEMLHCDFNYPVEMEGLIPFLPAAPGEPTGTPAMDARWRAYVHDAGVKYRKRRPC